MAIEQVEGIFAERRQLTVDEAFAVFRAYARAHHLELSEPAREIAEGRFDTQRIRT